MKSKYYKLFSAIALILSIFAVGSCKKNNYVIGKDILPPTYAKFNFIPNRNPAVRQDSNYLYGPASSTYFLNGTNTTYTLPIGITTVSGSDRTVQLSYSVTSNATIPGAQGVEFNAPTSVVIPAGSAIENLVISGIYSAYPTTARRDTLLITIVGTAEVPAGAYNNPYKLVLRREQ